MGKPIGQHQLNEAKLKSGDFAMAVTTKAVQILGGYGSIREYPVERFMRFG